MAWGPLETLEDPLGRLEAGSQGYDSFPYRYYLGYNVNHAKNQGKTRHRDVRKKRPPLPYAEHHSRGGGYAEKNTNGTLSRRARFQTRSKYRRPSRESEPLQTGLVVYNVHKPKPEGKGVK